MKKQAGFTLIELIMVIVILGILSAFALPRFADLSGNAESAANQGIIGALRSASAIARAACLADTACDTSAATSAVTLEGQAYVTSFGYLSAGEVDDTASPIASTELGILEASQIAGFAITGGDERVVGTSAGDITWDLNGNCVVTYSEATATTAASITNTGTCN